MLCRENKGADQLRSYCAADLGLFSKYAKNGSSHDVQTVKAVARLNTCICYNNHNLTNWLNYNVLIEKPEKTAF